MSFLLENRRGVQRPGGFSLIEVVMALAIIATVGITMIAMLPAGFRDAREATDLSIISRIIQSITSDANSSDWEEYTQRFSSGVWMQFYDDQGNVLENSGVQNHIYTASIELADSTNTDDGNPSVSLPGDEEYRIVRTNDLRKLLVRVTNVPGEQGVSLLESSRGDPNAIEYFVILSNFKSEAENGTN